MPPQYWDRNSSARRFRPIRGKETSRDAMACRERDKLDTPAGKERVARTKSASARSRVSVVKAASISRLVPALSTRMLQPPARARLRRAPRSAVSACAWLAGLTSAATRAAAGTSSCRIASRFATSSPVRKLMPVMLPPGRARLVTRPSFTGSWLARKTTGIVVVAALATSATSSPGRRDHGDSTANQIGRQSREPVDLILGEAVDDRDVLALEDNRSP